jgi:hypothetical protein
MAGASRIVAWRGAAFAAIVCVVCGVAPTIGQTTAAAAPPVLRDLAGIQELQSLFDEEVDKTRVVLLLSPT